MKFHSPLTPRTHLRGPILVTLLVLGGCANPARNSATTQPSTTRQGVIASPTGAPVQIPRMALAQLGVQVEREDRQVLDFALDVGEQEQVIRSAQAVPLRARPQDPVMPTYLVIPVAGRLEPELRTTDVRFRILREHVSASGMVVAPLASKSETFQARLVAEQGIWRIPLHEIGQHFPGVDPEETLRLVVEQEQSRVVPGQAPAVARRTWSAELRINEMDHALTVEDLPDAAPQGWTALRNRMRVVNTGHRPRTVWYAAQGSLTRQSTFEWSATWLGSWVPGSNGDQNHRHLREGAECRVKFEGGCSQMSSTSSPLTSTLFFQNTMREQHSRQLASQVCTPRGERQELAGVQQDYRLDMTTEGPSRALTPVVGWNRRLLFPGEGIDFTSRSPAPTEPVLANAGERCQTIRSRENIQRSFPGDLGTCRYLVERTRSTSCRLLSTRDTYQDEAKFWVSAGHVGTGRPGEAIQGLEASQIQQVLAGEEFPNMRRLRTYVTQWSR